MLNREKFSFNWHVSLAVKINKSDVARTSPDIFAPSADLMLHCQCN